MEICFFDKNSILGQIISQNSGCYPTKDKNVIWKFDTIFIFEKIKKLPIAHGQGYKWNTPPPHRQKQQRSNFISPTSLFLITIAITKYLNPYYERIFSWSHFNILICVWPHGNLFLESILLIKNHILKIHLPIYFSK